MCWPAVSPTKAELEAKKNKPVEDEVEEVTACVDKLDVEVIPESSVLLVDATTVAVARNPETASKLDVGKELKRQLLRYAAYVR